MICFVEEGEKEKLVSSLTSEFLVDKMTTFLRSKEITCEFCFPNNLVKCQCEFIHVGSKIFY